MSVIDQREPAAASDRRLDPFTMPTGAPAPRRPRLASYVGRTGRARRWLPPNALRVLDVGCATGYGTAGIAVAGPPGRTAVGVELDPDLLAEGRRRLPWLTILEGDATALPIADGCADAVLLLDVVEHVAEPARAIAEAYRVLRPGGALVLSVPHRGPLRGLDALNVYSALRRRHPSWRPLDAPTESASGMHLHFASDELAALLRPRFAVDRMTRTGIGLAELVQLARLLLGVRARAPRVRAALGWLYLIAYLVEDALPLGPLGYHLTVRACATPAGGAR